MKTDSAPLTKTSRQEFLRRLRLKMNPVNAAASKTAPEEGHHYTDEDFAEEEERLGVRYRD